MNKSMVIRIVASFISILLLIGLMLHGLGYTYAQADSNPYPIEIGIGETTTLTASRAYAWSNIDGSVAKLDASRAVATATVTGLKAGVTTISAGTAVGQVITFGIRVVDRNGSGGGGDNQGGGNQGGGSNGLAQIPGLDTGTAENTVLDFSGEKWLVIKNITMEGYGYAMLLRQAPLSVKCFSLDASQYNGSDLQREFTRAYSGSYIPDVLMKNAVVPNLGGESSTAVSMPTSKLASESGTTKDIIFPLSFKEAADWAGSTTSTKLYMNNQRWWLRTPNESQWYYVMETSTPNTGSIICSPTIALDGNLLYIRPAIWVKYELTTP